MSIIKHWKKPRSTYDLFWYEAELLSPFLLTPWIFFWALQKNYLEIFCFLPTSPEEGAAEQPFFY